MVEVDIRDLCRGASQEKEYGLMSAVNPFKDIKVIIGLIVTILITVALILGSQTVISWKEGYDQNQINTGKLESTSGIIDDGAKADENRAEVDQTVAQGRDQFNQDYEGAMRNEPETAARADRPVPDSVRKAFRERRIARERSGCAGQQCGEGPEASSPP
jgi:hypothetical protein